MNRSSHRADRHRNAAIEPSDSDVTPNPPPTSQPRPRNVRPHPLPTAESLPLEERLRLRDGFFRNAGIDPRQFLQAFDHVPGLSYFVQDAQSRTMLNTREYAELPDHPSDETIVGKRPGEYLARDLAEHYEADD